jgi:hypothetical protein
MIPSLNFEDPKIVQIVHFLSQFILKGSGGLGTLFNDRGSFL